MGFLRGEIRLTQPNRNASGTVLLIHGLFMGSWILSFIASHLRREGYRCYGYDYPTRIRRMDHHGKELADRLQLWPEKRFDVVTHSMGGLILREALSRAPELQERIGRIVMIAPPNQGSDLARFWREKFPVAERLVVPLSDLSSESGSPVYGLPNLPGELEFGVLAAENDHAVSEERTHLAGEREHRILPGRHTSILFRKRTAETVGHFLRHGNFGIPD